MLLQDVCKEHYETDKMYMELYTNKRNKCVKIKM